MQLKQRACVGAITLVALCGLPFVASSSANSGKPGSDLAGREHGAPPASKSQCKQYVARRVKILAEVEANFKRDQPKLAVRQFLRWIRTSRTAQRVLNRHYIAAVTG